MKDEGVQILTNLENMQNLRELYLSHNELTTPGAAAIASSANMQNLKELYLSNNQIDLYFDR